jgi:hypothetical protein
MQTRYDETDVTIETEAGAEESRGAGIMEVECPTAAGEEIPADAETADGGAADDAADGAEETAVEPAEEPDYFAGLGEENEARQRGKGIKFAVACVLLASTCSGAYLTVPAFKRAADNVFFQRAGGDPSAMAGESILDPYKKALEKIDSYGDRVDDATRALGVDPTKKLSAEQLARHDAQVKNIFGDAGTTTEERDKRIQEKFGHIGSITDAEIQAEPAAAATAGAGK